MSNLELCHLLIEHQQNPIGIDCKSPRFCWELVNEKRDTVQTAYQIIIRDENEAVTDTGKVESDDSIEVTVSSFLAEPKTIYQVDVTSLVEIGANVVGIMLSDGWWTGRVGLTGDSCQYGEPVRPVKILKPKSIIHTPAGELILDVGQVLAGLVEFTVVEEKGTEIKLEHTEVLDQHGNYFHNIVGANMEQTDIYIAKEGKQTYRPVFSYHGFRYVKITGWPGEPTVDDFAIYVLSSEMADIGKFVTSDEKINQLQSNIWWSQVSNTISIPTNCPQRERAGWKGT